MRLRVQTEFWAASLLAVIGLAPAGCGGKSEGGDDGAYGSSGGTQSGSGGTQSGSGGAVTGSGGAVIGTGGSAGTFGSGGAVGGFSSGGDAGALPVNQFPCNNPTPVVDVSSGYQLCDNGVRIRPFVAECESRLPRAEPVPNYDPTYSECQYDAECTAMPHGYCGYSTVDGPSVGAYCNYGCVTDSECGDGYICVCGEPIGYCVQATCTSDSDCFQGYHCASYDSSGGCGIDTFACQEPADTCFSNADCTGPCNIINGYSRECTTGGCAIGRPFLVDDVARVAALRGRSDWCAAGLRPALNQLEPVVRQRLAEEWTRAAQLEHASIAAFARFMLELLAFGAPAELVSETARAIDDERRHAKLCFALASAYAGEAIGPAALDVDGAIGAPDLGHSLSTAIREGCVGETVAALEAAELAERVSDPVLREVLEGIAGDEKRHAELAWKFVKGALGERPELATVVSSELLRVQSEVDACEALTTTPAHHHLARAGVAPAALKAAVRVEALRRIVLPGLCALVAQAQAAAA